MGKYDLRWEVLDIIIGGKSSIDSTQGFAIGSLEEADRFLRAYGFDLDNPIERAQAIGNFQEAISFIRKFFLAPENPDGIRLEIPRKILEITDIRDLFLYANFAYPAQSRDTQGSLLRNWACSILKVMHTIAHIDQDVRTHSFSDVQKQIFDRYYRVIQRDESGQLYLGEKPDDPWRVNLTAFETKPNKSRESTLMKLLHKPENVAEDIFDRIGIRFVAPTKLDAILVVQALKQHMLVIPPNIKPSRSRNTLLPLETVRSVLEHLHSKTDQKEEAWKAELEEAIEKGMKNAEGANPHTSSHYRAIQFTCRQLIKLKNPVFESVKELKGQARNGLIGSDTLRILDKIELKYLQKEVRFFYPYEVQIVDQKSHEENELGRSAHREYKKAQLMTALKRVMGVLSETLRG